MSGVARGEDDIGTPNGLVTAHHETPGGQLAGGSEACVERS